MSRGDNIQVILGAIGPFWPKCGLVWVPWSESFFCLVNHATFRQLCNSRFSPKLVTKRISLSCHGIRKDNSKIFTIEVICPENLKSKICQIGTSLRAGYRSRDALQTAGRFCLLHVVVQGPGSFRGLVNFSLRRTVAELRGVKIAQFSDFDLFSVYKTPKMYLLVTSLQPRGYIAEWFRFLRVVVKGPKGAFRDRRFPTTSGRGAGDPKLAQIFAYISIHNATTWSIRSGPKMSENEQFWRRMYFPTNIFTTTSKITAKPHFGGPFNVSLLYREPSVSRTLMELRRWNFTVIHVQAVLGVCQNFSARWPLGGRAP